MSTSGSNDQEVRSDWSVMADSLQSKQSGPVTMYDTHGDRCLAASYHEWHSGGNRAVVGRSPRLRLGRADQSMANQHEIGQRADSTRHRRHIARYPANRGKINIP